MGVRKPLVIVSGAIQELPTADTLGGTTTSSGTAIQFDRDRHYGEATALTGNLTLNSTGATPGMEAVIRHNQATAPSVPTEWKLLNGSYTASVDNYYVVHCFTTGIYLYTISQVKP